MPETIVDRLYKEFTALAQHLDSGAELSLRSTADECFRKALLLAAASYFENQVTSAILKFIQEASNNNLPVVEFVRNKVLTRQYHTLFNWDANNANQFYGLFGDKFKNFMTSRLKSDYELSKAVTAFLEMGRERNRLVHQDFGTYTLEKTSDEIFSLYRDANFFVCSLNLLLTESSFISND